MAFRTFSSSRWQLPFLGLLLTVLVTGAGVNTVFAAKQKYSEENRQKYNEQIKQRYDYRFGKNPWLPSQTQNTTGDFMPALDFPRASYCGQCHQEAHQQWRESAHSNSFRNPFYKRNVDILNNTKGIEFSRHCEGCHNPISLFSGALSKNIKIDRPYDEDGVTCMTCHSIAKIQNTSGMGSYVMGQPAVMLDEQGKPVPGLPSFDEILANPKRHAAAVMKDFYRTSEFCATCHKAAVPKNLNDYKWLRMFSVYDEWQNSSWSKESPLPFYKKDAVSTCQTCHMLGEASTITTDYGLKDGKLKSHRFLGASTTIPVFYGFDQQLKKVTEFLQNDLLNVDIFALSKGESEEIIAPLDKRDFTLTPGETITLATFIQNKGIGHSLVPEQRDFYESWVEFKVTDATGKVVAHSGYIKPDNSLDDGAHSYTNRIVGKDNQFLELHQVWQVRNRAFDQTILPGRSDLVRYQFAIPADAKSPLTATVNVNYRRFRQGWMDYALQKKGVQYPIVKMASRQIALNIGENVGSKDPADQKEMLRWNNYGIALWGQQQYARAVPIFEKTVQIKPDYVDGYINIALAQFSYEKYEPALVNLEKALQLSPNNARALFYRASIRRIQGQLAAAEADFKEVIRQYPRLRDAHRELGFVYYQQKKWELARQSYEALQGIDPDDLAAHYNLMLVYRRLGMKDKAAIQAAYYADRKEDRLAENASNEFLRKTPKISAESVPWHVHSLLEHPANAD
jgi:tetratricopeptide (TPR) repeat protein